jgi:hypothetical protein
MENVYPSSFRSLNAGVLVAQGRCRDEFAQIKERLQNSFWSNAPAYLYHAARVYAFSADLLENTDPGEAKRLRQRAVELLKLAVNHGWSDIWFMQIDPNLNAIRDTPAFSTIVKELSLPRYAVVHRDADPEHPPTQKVLLELPVEEHLHEAWQLAENGFTPLTIAATASNRPAVVVSCWTRSSSDTESHRGRIEKLWNDRRSVARQLEHELLHGPIVTTD